MTIAAIVFSRDRAAQLDLLLASLELNGRGAFEPVHVLWRATGEPYERAYGRCAAEHPDVGFLREGAFATQVADLVQSSAWLTFFTDDSVLFESVTTGPSAPETWLAARDELLCFSLRLGRNCAFCYPLARPQRLPEFTELDPETLAWSWREADGDFGYPGSLDGHVFRNATVVDLLSGGDFTNPNTLEGLFASRITTSSRPAMASYGTSRLVGLPVNRVNETHPNRFGDRWPYGVSVLNERYLAGDRLDPAAVDAASVTGAHAELPLRWRSLRG